MGLLLSCKYHLELISNINTIHEVIIVIYHARNR
jgi:hypothetical protein